jgi:AraC-like DNA-binding protein
MGLPHEAVFEVEPVGRHFVGRTFVYFHLEESLWGFSIWGTPTEDDVGALIARMDIELSAAQDPHLSLVDFEALDRVDGPAFESLHRYTEATASAWGQKLVRQALIHGSGLAGLVTAGYYSVYPRRYPARGFASIAEGIDWLKPDRPDLAMRVTELRERARGVPEIVAEVRRLVASDLPGVTLHETARRLGCAARTLQRKLNDAGTSFHREHTAIQVEEAKRLLADSDLKIAVIAQELGCQSASHFSQIFRERTGRSPSDFRAERK